MEQKNQKQLVRVPVDQLKPHPSDPFKPYQRDKLRELADSIYEFGLFNPIVITDCAEGGYYILSGKNRAAAFAYNNYPEIDAFLVDADDDTAAMIITDSNLKHRDRLLPSERGFAYLIQYEAMKRQGKKTHLYQEITSGLIDPKTRTRKIVAEHNSVGENDIKRYIRLTHLIPELLAHVDDESIPLYSGVDLSFLDKPSQRVVYDSFFVNGPASMDLERSGAIKALYNEKKTITEEMINKLVFRRGEVRERVVPLINRKMLGSIVTETELPDDETLIRLFAEFLRDKFNASGKIELVQRRSEKIL